VAPAGAGTEAQGEAIRSLFDPALGRQVDARIVARDRMAASQRIAGPAMITERETTVVVPSGFTATMRADGTIEVMREAAANEREAAE
jgi:N-methylhydantoinase A